MDSKLKTSGKVEISRRLYAVAGLYMDIKNKSSIKISDGVLKDSFASAIKSCHFKMPFEEYFIESLLAALPKISNRQSSRIYDLWFKLLWLYDTGDFKSTGVFKKPYSSIVPTAAQDLVLLGFDAEFYAWELIVCESTLHLGLINKEVGKLISRVPNNDPAELTGYGWYGLRLALRQYDPSRGYAFSTYACPRINGAVRDGVRSEHHLPKRLTTFVRQVSKATEELSLELSRPPTYQEIGEYLDVEIRSVKALNHMSEPASLNQLSLGDEGETMYPKCLVDGQDTSNVALENMDMENLHAILKSLDPLERIVIFKLFFEESTLAGLSKELKMSVKSLRELRNTALSKVRALIEADVQLEHLFSS